jgi:hypothetical protein
MRSQVIFEELKKRLFPDVAKLEITVQHRLKAMATLHRKNQMDHYEATAPALSISLLVHAEHWARLLARTVACPNLLQSLVISGAVLGKETPPIAEDNTRAILPQPLLLELLRAILADFKYEPMNYARQLKAEDIVLGAWRGHQVMEPTYALQIALELGLDTAVSSVFARAASSNIFPICNLQSCIANSLK